MDVLKDKHAGYRKLRRSMVDRQIARRGVHAPLVLDAMRFVPLVGEEGWTPDRPDDQPLESTPARLAPIDDARIASSIALNCEAITHVMACSWHFPGNLLREDA